MASCLSTKPAHGLDIGQGFLPATPRVPELPAADYSRALPAVPDGQPRPQAGVRAQRGLRRRLTFGALRARCSGYRTEAQDLIKYFGVWPSAEVVNIDHIVIWGVEGAGRACKRIGPLSAYRHRRLAGRRPLHAAEPGCEGQFHPGSHTGIRRPLLLRQPDRRMGARPLHGRLQPAAASRTSL